VGARQGAVAVSVVRIATPFRDFLAWWERAADLAASEQHALWDAYVARNPEAFDNYERWFGDWGALDEALPRYPAVSGDLERRFAALDLEQGARRVADLLRVEGPFRAICFVGLFTANAWADAVDGVPTVFFALESDPPELWHPSLAVHEFAHLAHERLGARAWSHEVPGLTLMCEAVAISTARALAPGIAPEREFGVEDHAAWDARCREGWDDARPKLLAGLETHDDRARRRFFWPDWGRDDHDVPERVGYFAASAVAERLLSRHELDEIARWRSDRALAEARTALEAL
jgi:hypothetical protein